MSDIYAINKNKSSLEVLERKWMIFFKSNYKDLETKINSFVKTRNYELKILLEITSSTIRFLSNAK